MTFGNKITTDKAKDTGLALVLILLLFVATGKKYLLLPAIGVVLLNMTWPAAFKPLARLWFGFSELMGTVASKVLLTVVFFLVATPIGLIRRLAGADAMRRKGWRDGSPTAFVERGHEFVGSDLEKPY